MTLKPWRWCGRQILFLQCRKYQACRTTNATKGPINRTLLKISIVTRNENKPKQNATELFPAPQHETQKLIEISRCIAVSPNNFIFRWFFQTTPFFCFAVLFTVEYPPSVLSRVTSSHLVLSFPLFNHPFFLLLQNYSENWRWHDPILRGRGPVPPGGDPLQSKPRPEQRA